ncbi:transposable element Tcb2 transposase [Trichonephila clavipes]|nr:transposable element Tcb2 transposase [Trichonephila clavipes]
MWNVTDWQKVAFSDESLYVLGTDDNRVRVWRCPDPSMTGRSPDLSPVEHVWDQLKRKMSSCHSVHDLELAVVYPSASGQHKVLDESRSFFRVHTGYFSNIPKCIKAEFIASWACSQSSVVSSSKR